MTNKDSHHTCGPIMTMTSTNTQNCSICSITFAELDTPVKCDGCNLVFHTKCTSLSVSELKCLSLKNQLIINEIGERNIRASNLILYNITESNSDNTTDRITHDSNVVSNLIDSIITSGDKNIRPIKLLRLGIRGHDKPRPIKAILSLPADVFEILKSKKKLLSLNPPSNIGISSDRTLNQKNYMKKLREELESRRSSEGGAETN
ncbi:uncharacterized protein LOC132925092 [Rhopalosiphum padi]|uniref:uncharacterized protein LOC132925092 n=1 Tax=Rhopalosiphum padi TaxID=40932 RepID=UPI00298D8821|nr:uncharacterized protein LOC132925092 [Rhopalosiphum padi]